MDRSEIISKMKEHLAQYTILKQELAKLEAPNKKLLFEKQQRQILEKFKSKYTVMVSNKDLPDIDWDYFERMLFSDLNLENHSLDNSEHCYLGYDKETGMAGFFDNWKNQGLFIPFAYDKVDAERFIERQTVKKQLSTRKDTL